MKLMIVGSDKVYAIENFYVRYLQAEGVTVNHFPAQSYFYDFYQKSIVNKLLFRSGLSSVLNDINKQFLATVQAFKPDVVWVFKGMEIFPESLRRVSEMGIALVNYNPDNPFVFTGRGSGNSYVTEAIGLYDMHFTYNLAIKAKLETAYGMKTFLLPFGFDVDDQIVRECLLQEEVGAVCFLGNPDEQRAAFISKVAEAGIAVDLYGHGWDKFVHHDVLRCMGPVYGKDFWKTLYRYRVQLNLMRVHNEDSHNMRTFEVPGIGGIELAPDTTEHRLFFSTGEEFFLYDSFASFCKQAHHILSLNKADAAVIRQQARQKSITSGYHYQGRALQALAALKTLTHG